MHFRSCNRPRKYSKFLDLRYVHPMDGYNNIIIIKGIKIIVCISYVHVHPMNAPFSLMLSGQDQE